MTSEEEARIKNIALGMDEEEVRILIRGISSKHLLEELTRREELTSRALVDFAERFNNFVAEIG